MSDDRWRDTQPSPGGPESESFASQPAHLEPVADSGDSVDDPADATSDAVETPNGAVAVGDTERWATYEPLYHEHHDRLYRIAVLLCAGNTTDAEDAVAETFVHVHRAWLDGRVDDFFSFARGRLVGHVMSRYRKQQAAMTYMTVTGPDQGDDDRPNDEDVADSAAVLDALGKLSPRRRVAVVLRFFEDLSYHEIAQTMDASLEATKAQVSTGLEQLRQLLEGGGS